MINWINYNGHIVNKMKDKEEIFDNTIYTFDIETTSYLVLDNKQLNTIEYLKLTEEEKKRTFLNGSMYIWMFGINQIVYYGRTWEELKLFLDRLEKYTNNIKKYVFVHNLSFEFQFMRNCIQYKNVFSRKSRKVIKCELLDYNIEFRCTYYMTNVKLERIPKIYNLSVNKLVGNLDYSKIRHSKTYLTQKELNYCENDCAVIYQYIKLQLEKFKKVKRLPLTSTGFVRRELKAKIYKNYKYKNKVKKSINTDGNIFNLLEEAFMRRVYSRKLDKIGGGYKKCYEF